MAKVSPVSIKYMIHANFIAEGALEKPDVIGALFGQTEGLLGEQLEMRELQKEGKIGRIEVELHRENKKTMGYIKIPTALDKSETTLIGAAIETIERIGPSDAQIEVEKIEDVRGTKRDYIIERAKKLMQSIEGTADSREISQQIRSSARTADIKEYGEEKLPYGTLDSNELIVVEGRADVLNLVRNGISNVIAMNGTKLPDSIKELSKEKEITLFVDGDRGGKLIARNAVDNANVKYIAIAPDGKEVEELTGKEIHMILRKRKTEEEFFRENRNFNSHTKYAEKKFSEKDIKFLREIAEKNQGSGKAVLIDENLEEIKKVSVKTLAGSLKRLRKAPLALIIDGTATKTIISAAEDSKVQAIVAKNFASMSEKIQMIGL